MPCNEDLECLSDFVLHVRELEDDLDDLIEPFPTDGQIIRKERTRAALSRCRGQVNRLIAEIVIGGVSRIVGDRETCGTE